MNNLIQIATVDLAEFLRAQLPLISKNWWKSNVVNVLSYQQQRMVEDRGLERLEQLDFSSLLRVLDQNWYELQQQNNFPREGRNWVKELLSIRNKWAHLSAQGVSQDELYRDADTLGRVLDLLGAPSASVTAIEDIKAGALSKMVNSHQKISLEQQVISHTNTANIDDRPLNNQSSVDFSKTHICDQLVYHAKYLEQHGFTQLQLSSLHHFSLQGKDESFSATYEYFSCRKNLQTRNRNYANRIIYVSTEHQKHSGQFPYLISQALEKWPLI